MPSKYERVYDYVGAYELEAWESASQHAWAQLDMIASEYQRGDRNWASAKKLLDDLHRYVHSGP